MIPTTETGDAAMDAGFRLTEIHRTGVRETTARVEIDPDAHWFSGHFPGDPMVPGIVQLEMAVELVLMTHGKKIRPAGIRRVRFKRIIRPQDRPTLAVRQTAAGGNTYSFRLMLADEPACTGTLTVDDNMENENT